MADFLGEILEFLTAILGLGGAYFAWRSQTRKQLIIRLEDEIAELKQSIQKYTGRVNPESDRKLIKTAKRSIQVLGTNSLRVLHHSREDIISFLKQGGQFQILLLDPRKQEFRDRAELEEDHVGRIKAEWNASAKILSGIHEKSGAADRIEIRLYDQTPDRSLVMVDGLGQMTEATSVLINYYPDHRGVRGYEGVQFLAQKRVPRDVDSLTKNQEHFTKLWGTAEPFGISELESLDANIKL